MEFLIFVQKKEAKHEKIAAYTKKDGSLHTVASLSHTNNHQTQKDK